jgi:hypothetical protein
MVNITTARAEDGIEPERHDFSVHIFYPLSTTETPADFSYINASLIYGRIGEVRGIDLSHGFSRVSGDMRGVQASNCVTYVGGELWGVSGTGIASLVSGDIRGVQSAGLLSWTGGDVYGVQTSGIVNVAGEVNGVQAGLVNISRQMNGVPIGLINISENGGVQMSGWYSSLTEANTGLRFRAGNFYSLFAFGFTGTDYSGLSETVDSTRIISHSFALGASIPVGFLRLNMDAGILNIDRQRFYEIDEDHDRWGVRYRGMIELPLFGGVSVFGGVGASYLVDAKEEPTEDDFADGEWEELYFIGAGIEL